MTDNRPLGIVAVAVGIPESVQNRFTFTLQATTPPGFELRVVTEMDGFTRSKGRNLGISTLLGKCRVIVCTDIDMLIPAGLVEYTQNEVTDGWALWAKCRNVPASQADSLNWEAWKKLPVREMGRGSWIAMTAADWLKTGGWDERLAGYGAEDNVLEIRRAERGIETKVTRDFPLMHVDHARRDARSERVGATNLRRGTPQPPKNFLTARLEILDHAHNHFNIFTTSRCNRDCPQCSQRGFRTWGTGYELSLDDLTEWITCTKESGYPPYRSVILTGGEPLLWENLEEGARLLRQSGVSQQLNLFSNGDMTDRVTDKLMESLTTLRLSRYGDNALRVELLKERYGAKVSVVKRQAHFRLPIQLAGDEVLPAKCGCQGPALMGRRVYGCAMLLTVANDLGMDLSRYPESQCDLQVGYLELLAGFPRARHDCCRGCIGNLALRKQAVRANP